MNKQENLVWIDLEMTGLDASHDVLLEIATIITDKDLNILAKTPSIIIHQSDDKLKKMKPVVENLHNTSGLIKKVQEATTTVQEAEQETINLIKKYCLPNTNPLCGNSVWQDRIFLAKYMPSIIDFLHYRIIDVTSFKEVITRWYPKNPHAFFKKKDTHRALEDIKESIEELKQYRTHFFQK